MLNDTDKQQIVSILMKINPYRIVLFGSYADGNEKQDSDLDLYVIINENYMPETYNEKIKLKCKVSKVLDPLRIHYPIDLIVHTIPMYQKFKYMNSVFSQNLLNNGVVLYEADHA